MKLFCSISIIITLFLGTGFTAYSQENSYNDTREVTQDTLKVRLADNRIIIENLPKDDILEIYNIMGVKVYTRRLKAGTNEYPLSLPKGYYIIKIGKFTKKVAIK